MLVRALKDCFPDGTFRKKGEQFEYKGPKNENLEAAKEPRPDADEAPAAAEHAKAK